MYVSLLLPDLTSAAIGLTVIFFWSVTAIMGLSTLTLFSNLDDTRIGRAIVNLLIFAVVTGAGMILFWVIVGAWDLMLTVTGRAA